MKYKLLTFILIFSLLLGSVVSAEPKFRYTYEEALEMALENSIDYKNKHNAISNKYDAFEAAEKSAPSEVKFIGSMKKFISDQVDPIIKVDEAYFNYQEAILDRNNTEIEIGLKLRSAVIAVEKAEMELEEANMNREMWESELELLELKMDKNLISQSEYLSKKEELENKLENLDKYDEELDEAYYNLNTLLGREDEKDIAITLDDTVVPLDKLDLEQIKKDMMKKDSTLVKKKNERSVAKYYFALVEERYLKYDLDKFTDSMLEEISEMYEEAEENFETADRSYEDALASFEREFEEMIEAIEDNIEEINDIKEEIEEEQEKAKIYKIKYEAHIISKKEYDNSINQIIKLQNDLKYAELQLNLKYAKLLAYSDLEEVVLE